MSSWPEPKLVNTGDLNLAVYEYGDSSNPKVLLLHGFVSTGLTWHDLCLALADTWHVIAVDQRGRSFSDHAPDGDYSTASYVKDAKALLDQLGIERLALIGHSMGGMNSLVFAATYPEMVSSLVLVDHAPETDFSALEQTRKVVAGLDRDFADWEEARIWLRGIQTAVSDDVITRRLHARMVEQDGRIGWREDPGIRAYQQSHPMRSEAQRWDDLSRVQCRTLFVLGGESRLISDETAKKAASIAPEGKWVRITGAGHNVFEDNPTECNSTVTEFLSADPQQ